VLKHQNLFRSDHLVFGLKPDLKTGFSPGAKAPGYSAKRLCQGTAFLIQSFQIPIIQCHLILEL